MNKNVQRIITAILIAFTAFLLTPKVSASAATNPDYGGWALNWAEANATGHWYGYGGTGPEVYDCSGLVSTAVLKADHIWIGRDTYVMLATMGEGHFVPIPLSEARRGDILFFGAGHVTFDTAWYHTAFQAEQPGTRIGWYQWGWGWAPTMAFRIV